MARCAAWGSPNEVWKMDDHFLNAASRSEATFSRWLEQFEAFVTNANSANAATVFSDDSYWKDLLAFTWEHRVFGGREEITRAMGAAAGAVKPRNFRPAEGRPAPKRRGRARREVIEGFFDFDTETGSGSGFVRLVPDADNPDDAKAWVLLTTLQSLRGFEEKIGSNRPTGDEFSRNEVELSWAEGREQSRRFEDRDPEVIVIGAGHAGLVAAARLRQLGVDVLVVEQTPRVGDIWRARYTSLTLHNELMANHLPYMPFPDTWPVWLTKDQLANWLEAYAQFMELNVWTSTTFEGGNYDEATKSWTVTLRRDDGFVRELNCRHIVVSTGISGSVPKRAEIAGLADFRGEVLHSAEFTDGSDYAGRNVLVVGTGNSAHDIAQDMFVKGAANVSMLQRGPTCVISLKPGAAMIYNIYNEDARTEDIDLIAASIPYHLLADIYRGITQKAAKMDSDLLERLNKVGFKTYFGRDDTGFQMMYMRGEGGYYIDVGCSEMIANGSIGVLQTSDSDGFVQGGLKMKDGSTVPLDAVVLATGFENMQENIRQMFGDTVADKVGSVWGFDEHYQMRAMWRRTGQEGLWITGGALLDSRIFSRFMALEIKAELAGLLPEKNALPLASLQLAHA